MYSAYSKYSVPPPKLALVYMEKKKQLINIIVAYLIKLTYGQDQNIKNHKLVPEKKMQSIGRVLSQVNILVQQMVIESKATVHNGMLCYQKTPMYLSLC